ncbi:MAG: hypothetical protein GY822_28335 [Deltaproteobacteria bacterium]|nr:hypothetical protein [Deltaproteobacteria bacterium]
MTSPFAHLCRIFLTLLLVSSVSGIPGMVPLLASLDAGEVSQSCCPEESSDDGEERPCSPLCSECACGVGVRVASDRLPIELDGPNPSPTLDIRPVPTGLRTIASGFFDELLRPPRV